MKKIIALVLLCCFNNSMAHHVKDGKVLNQNIDLGNAQSATFCEKGHKCRHVRKHKHHEKSKIQFNSVDANFALPRF